jgi:hypothetical protein
MGATTTNPLNEQAMADAALAISEYVAELEKRIEMARRFTAEEAIAVSFLREFSHLEANALPADEHGYQPYVTQRFRVHLALDPGTVNALMINFDATALAEVTEPLRWLAARLGKYEIEDYAALGRRAYVFANDGRAVRFQVFFNGDKSACKFVQVGEKTEPVYKLMCGESEATA